MVDERLWWIAFAIIWVVCGVLNYGYTFGYFQREFPSLRSEHKEEEDRRMALVFGILGPLGTVIIWVMNGMRHGLMYRSKDNG